MVWNANFCTITRYVPGGRFGMLYRPSALVSPGNLTLVSTLVTSTLTPAITPPLTSVTRPVRVAVGPATKHAANGNRSAKRWLLGIIDYGLRNFIPTTPEYAARIAVLYQTVSGMIGVRLQVGVKKLAACGPGTSTRALDSHKDRVDFRQNAGILELEHPAVLFLIVHKEDTQALSGTLGRPAS